MGWVVIGFILVNILGNTTLLWIETSRDVIKRFKKYKMMILIKKRMAENLMRK